MNKLEQLQKEIANIPDEFNVIRNVCLNSLAVPGLSTLRDYTCGLYDMATHLTSDEKLLTTLRKVRDLLK